MLQRIILLALTVSVSTAGAWAAEMQIAPDGMAQVDGERTFILGLYENPEDDAVLQDAVKAGFNLIHASADKESLDRLENAGAHAWLNTGYTIDFSETPAERREALDKLVADHAQHPALLVWEVPDEALWNCWYQAQQWRAGEEPTRQGELIAALEDEDKAEELTRMLREAGALCNQGRYAESEALADSLWEKLGQAPPKPGYGTGDAQARAEKMCGGMIEGYKRLREADPRHPVWMNHAPRNQISQLAAFNKAADIVGCDIYPVPDTSLVSHSDLTDQTLSAVGAYTQRMQAAAPEKPVWMVLQGFGWGDILPELPAEDREKLRRPTFNETRFMAYDAIVNGARGILYWGTSYIEKDSQLWQDLLKMVAELDGLQHVLAAPDVPLERSFKPTYGSLDREVLALGKDVDGELWIIAAKEWQAPLTYNIALEGKDGQAYEDTASGERATVEAGKLTLTLPPYGVHVLKPVGEG